MKCQRATLRAQCATGRELWTRSTRTEQSESRPFGEICLVDDRSAAKKEHNVTINNSNHENMYMIAISKNSLLIAVQYRFIKQD